MDNELKKPLNDPERRFRMRGKIDNSFQSKIY